MLDKNQLILFDFDGTLTKKDSFIEFIAFSKGRLKLYIGFIIYSLNFIKFFLGLIPNWRLKELIVTFFFKGYNINELNLLGQRFTEEVIPKILRPGAIDLINKYKNAGNSRIVVVSASCSNWIRGWTDNLGLELISTELEVENNLVTGKLGTPNCHGPEKVKRIKSYLNISDFSYIIAYGDSSGDKEMLELAHESYFKFL